MGESVVFLAALICVCSALMPSLTSAYTALVSPITKDPLTSLYTIAVGPGAAALVLDLASPLTWSLCSPVHPTVRCKSRTCAVARRYHAANCPPKPKLINSTATHCNCTAYPVNPITGICAAGDLTKTTVTSNTTDGKTTLSLVSVPVTASCAPASLLASLPANSSGVAGLARSTIALPWQLSSHGKIARRFGLCLSAYGVGVALFGGGPFYLLYDWEVTGYLSYTKLIKNRRKPALYYLPVKAIATYPEAVQLPAHAFDIGKDGTGGFTINITTPYTGLRSDIYRPFISAYEKASKYIVRAPSVAPFELCYESQSMAPTRMGYDVPVIELMLEGGKNWTIWGGNSMKDVSESTACLAFVDLGPAAEEAAVLGGFQMEDNYLQFDLKNNMLGFSDLLYGIETTCGDFNFSIYN